METTTEQPQSSEVVQNELETARAMAGGSLPSPQKLHNLHLFDVRISGTGVAYRKKHDEFVLRNPEDYLNDDFLARCNGLPVILEHPKKEVLDSDEFADRIIGTIFLPYIKGDEVWGIAKILDDAAAQMMSDEQLSTSPSVFFSDDAGNSQIELGGGSHLLIEGKPSLLDHLAIVASGVWDKGGKPSGVKIETRADSSDEAEFENKGATKMEETLAKILEKLESLDSRMSTLELAEEEEVIQSEAKSEAKSDGLPPPALEVKGEEQHADNAKPSEEIVEMQKRIDGIETKLATPSEEEGKGMADAQAKADAVYSAFGDSAPRPLQGESLMAYRKRLATKMQAHSKNFKEVNLAGIADASTFDAIEKSIYADAQVAAASPADVPAGMLFERVSTDRAGRKISTFEGHPSAWTSQFKAQKKSLMGINKQVH